MNDAVQEAVFTYFIPHEESLTNSFPALQPTQPAGKV
jgi:hypothetical protein